MADVYENFIDPMLLQFALPRPAENNRKAFFMDYAEALRDFTADELAYAAKWLKTTRETRTFPVIADCLEACKHARKAIRASSYQPKPRQQDPDEWLPHRVDRASRLIQSDMGCQAVKDGAIIGLHDFIRKHERLPDAHEYKLVARESKKTWKYVDDAIEAMKANGQDATMAIKLRKMMKGKYLMLSEKVKSSKEAA